MKKFFIILVAFCFAFSLTAVAGLDISADVGLGYMNYTLVTVYKDDLDGKLAEGLSGLGAGKLKFDALKVRDTYNALMFGLGVKVSYFYTNISVGLPFKNVPLKYDPLAMKILEHNPTDDIKGSMILDAQFGGGITFFKETPLNIFAGGAVAVNFIRAKRILPDGYVATLTDTEGNSIKPLIDGDLTEFRLSSMIGLGLNAAVMYYFTPNIGVAVDLKDSIYFLPLFTNRYYRGTHVNGRKFTYSIFKDSDEKINIKDLIKYAYSNDFELRIGVSFKF